jgi:hypothetical protein
VATKSALSNLSISPTRAHSQAKALEQNRDKIIKGSFFIIGANC